MALFGKRSRATYEIQPEDIFVDSSNLPGRNEGQFEGRVVRPVASRAILGVGLVFAAVILVFAWRAFHLEIVQGTVYADISRNNRLDRSVVFATRGRIFDRTGLELAWNEAPLATSTLSGAAAAAATSTLDGRRYTALPSLFH